jgi:hypothetical protein
MCWEALMNTHLRLNTALVLAMTVGAVMPTLQAQGPVGIVYEPSADHPRIKAALAARARMETSGGDVRVMEQLFADDLVVNSPINMVVNRDNVLGRMRSGQIVYEEGQSVIEFVGIRGDAVVIMGEEIVKPMGAAPYAGQTVRRRFTDIWMEIKGAWKLSVRQATITAVR